MSSPQPFVAIAGATGQLGSLIALALRKRSIPVKALIRPSTSPSRTQALRDAGVTIVEVDLSDIPTLTTNLQGATTLVSALQGLRPIIHIAQGNLLTACLAAKVPRFIPSDFSLDFTKTTPGSNRNLDLRREFHATLDESGISWTSVLNGAFMELLTDGKFPMINHSWKRVMHFGSAEQKLDFTTIPDTAEFTAMVAADTNPTPKFMRCAGDSLSPRELAATVSKVQGEEYGTMWTGGVGFLRALIAVLKFFIGGVEDNIFPPWQGMQYLENMVSGKGKLDPVDNGRYPELTWTSVDEAMREKEAKKDV